MGLLSLRDLHLINSKLVTLALSCSLHIDVVSFALIIPMVALDDTVS